MKRSLSPFVKKEVSAKHSNAITTESKSSIETGCSDNRGWRDDDKDNNNNRTYKRRR